MPEVTKRIVKHFGVMSESDKGWTKELNLVSWNEKDPKYDIREWAPDKNKTGKGITMKKPEIILLKKMLEELSFEGMPEDLPEDTSVLNEAQG